VAILVDQALWHLRGERWCHLVSDESFDELHAFVDGLGLGIPRRAFHGDHYDVPSEWYDEVLSRGVEPVSSRELVERLVAAGLRRRKPRPA
jgi:hypothetical protein